MSVSWSESDSKKLDAIRDLLQSIASSQAKLLDKIEETNLRLRRIEEAKAAPKQDRG